MTIRNKQDNAIILWTVDSNGNLEKKATANPNKVSTQRTYGTHPWIITDETGATTIAYFVPQTANLKVTVE